MSNHSPEVIALCKQLVEMFDDDDWAMGDHIRDLLAKAKKNDPVWEIVDFGNADGTDEAWGYVLRAAYKTVTKIAKEN